MIHTHTHTLLYAKLLTTTIWLVTWPTIFVPALKLKNKNVLWTSSSSGPEGLYQSGSKVDFYVDNVC